MPHRTDSFTGPGHWQRAEQIEGYGYRCGYCGRDVAPTTGWQTDKHNLATIRICPHCNAPSFFTPDHPVRQYPGPLIGNPIRHLPKDVKALYDEARSSTAARAYTGAMMLCRTILMHVAVEKGILGNDKTTRDISFLDCVNWLLKEGYAPKGAEAWVDYIRERGNAANHEIVVMTEKDAAPVVLFTEALLRGMYELPELVPQLPENEEKESGQASTAASKSPEGQFDQH